MKSPQREITDLVYTVRGMLTDLTPTGRRDEDIITMVDKWLTRPNKGATTRRQRQSSEVCPVCNSGMPHCFKRWAGDEIPHSYDFAVVNSHDALVAALSNMREELIQIRDIASHASQDNAGNALTSIYNRARAAALAEAGQ